MLYDRLSKEYLSCNFPNGNYPCKIVQPSWKESRIIARLIRVHNLNDPNMIERKPKEIRSSRFWVSKTHGKLSGSIGIIDWGSDGIEIVSHFVCEKFRGKGIGQKLLDYALKEAKRRRPISIFTFTTKPDYYAHFGFSRSEVKNYPKKLREKCANCPKNKNGPGVYPCLEIAMQIISDLR